MPRNGICTCRLVLLGGEIRRNELPETKRDVAEIKRIVYAMHRPTDIKDRCEILRDIGKAV